MTWKTIEDYKVRNIWKCEDEDCTEDNMEAEINPDWYEQNGTPVCGCGLDMVYQRTEISTE